MDEPVVAWVEPNVAENLFGPDGLVDPYTPVEKVHVLARQAARVVDDHIAARPNLLADSNHPFTNAERWNTSRHKVAPREARQFSALGWPSVLRCAWVHDVNTVVRGSISGAKPR